ncbi:MAG: glycosyltransferase family 2 protein [Fibrobacterota bacterium]
MHGWPFIILDGFISIDKKAVIIPVFNEEKKIGGLLDSVKSALPEDSLIIVVDDGSTDGSFDIIKQKGVEEFRHSENRGKGSAIVSGLRKAKRLDCSFAVIMDGDGQHDPSDLEGFFRIMGRWDMVLGVRKFFGTEMPFLRKLSNVISSAAVSVLCRKRFHDVQCGYRAVNVEKALGIAAKSLKFEYEAELLIDAARKGLLITEVPVKTVYEPENFSKIKPFKDLCRFLFMYIRKIFKQC